MRNDDRWEAIACGLEKINFATLSEDEKRVLPGRMIETLFTMDRALVAGECALKTANRINRAIRALNKQVNSWLKLHSR